VLPYSIPYGKVTFTQLVRVVAELVDNELVTLLQGFQNVLSLTTFNDSSKNCHKKEFTSERTKLNVFCLKISAF
jgi:hypothetical protein